VFESMKAKILSEALVLLILWTGFAATVWADSNAPDASVSQQSNQQQQADESDGFESFFPENSDTGYDSGKMFFKMLFSVMLVIVLGGAAVYVSKRFLPKLTSTAGKNIVVIETVHLDRRNSVHMLKIGGKKLLLGSNSDRLTLLWEIPDDFQETLKRQEETGD